ncbi:hypothetical protein H0H93_010178 [Arthromyces matolae]|nr:hypothetical protein H0H93_010178 [Arthromyces matolae]
MPTSKGKNGKSLIAAKIIGQADAKSSFSTRAGLQFPVGRIRRFLKKTSLVPRISTTAPVYFAAVLEYLVAEIAELSGNAARDHKKLRITPRHILLAVKNDAEFAFPFFVISLSHSPAIRLDELLGNVVISEGGVGTYTSYLAFLRDSYVA